MIKKIIFRNANMTLEFRNWYYFYECANILCAKVLPRNIIFNAKDVNVIKELQKGFGLPSYNFYAVENDNFFKLDNFELKEEKIKPSQFMFLEFENTKDISEIVEENKKLEEKTVEEITEELKKDFEENPSISPVVSTGENNENKPKKRGRKNK